MRYIIQNRLFLVYFHIIKIEIFLNIWHYYLTNLRCLKISCSYNHSANLTQTSVIHNMYLNRQMVNYNWQSMNLYAKQFFQRITAEGVWWCLKNSTSYMPHTLQPSNKARLQRFWKLFHPSVYERPGLKTEELWGKVRVRHNRALTKHQRVQETHLVF